MLLALIVVSAIASTIAVIYYPAFFQQHLAWKYLLEPLSMLAIYGFIAELVMRRSGKSWESIRRIAGVFGVITGIVEIANVVLENIDFGIPRGPLVSVAFMLLVFVLWGFAAAWSCRECNSVRAGIACGVLSSGICMLIAVASGFVFQFFVFPPDPAKVATWAEFKRSGWTDPGAFGLANTLDSGFTHLIVAPFVALIFGSAGCLLLRGISRQSRSLCDTK
jgi:hypothetical protein